MGIAVGSRGVVKRGILLGGGPVFLFASVISLRFHICKQKTHRSERNTRSQNNNKALLIQHLTQTLQQQFYMQSEA